MNQPVPPSQRRPDGTYQSGPHPGEYRAPPYYPGHLPPPQQQTVQQQTAQPQSVPQQATPRPAKDSEQLLAEALRAMASGAASLGSAGNQSSHRSAGPSSPQSHNWTEMILLSIIVGLTIGIVVGLASFYW